MMRVGIISYLPHNEKRESRKANINRILDKLLLIIPEGVKIYVVAQGYDEEDYRPEFNYFKFKEGLGPSKARNVLLDEFYKSDDDNMLYIDDGYHAKDLLYEWHTNPDKFKMIDVCGCVNGRFTPFTKKNSALDLDNFYHFDKLIFQTTGECRIIKNFRKIGKPLIWYDENCPLGEDLKLRLQIEARKDIFVYQCSNLIQGSFCMRAKQSVCWDAESDSEYYKMQLESAMKIKEEFHFPKGRLLVRFKQGQNTLLIPNEYKKIKENLSSSTN